MLMSPLLKYMAIVLPVVLLTACFGGSNSPGEENGTTNSGVVLEQKIVTPEEQIAASNEYNRIQALEELTPENLGTMLQKKDGKTEVYDRRLFINFLKSKKISSTESLIEKFAEIEEFTKKEGVPLSRSDVLVSLIGFDNETIEFDMCKDFKSKQTKLSKDSPVYRELSEYCPLQK